MGELLKNYSTGVLKNPWGKATEAGTLRKKQDMHNQVVEDV
jgi:hypothetical protein